MKTSMATCFFLFPLVLLFASCVIPESNHVEPTYHLLTELQSDRNDTSEIGRVSFYVRQVELPSYLQESRLVSRPKQGLIEFTENDRWGEPLEEGVARVLGLNLSKRLNALSYSVYPHRQKPSCMFELGIAVQRFEPGRQCLRGLGARASRPDHPISIVAHAILPLIRLSLEERIGRGKTGGLV